MSGRFHYLADFVVDHRAFVFCFLLALTVVAAIGHYDPRILLPDRSPPAPPVFAAESESSSDAPPPPNVEPVQVARGDVIVVARSDSFFTPEGADAIRAAVAALLELDQVRDILWMDQAPMMNLFGLPEPILPRGHASMARFEAARERALEHPLVVGQLLSPDAQTLLLLVDLDWLFILDDADCTNRLRDAAAEAAAEFPGVEIDFQVTGNVPIRVSNAANTRGNEKKYQFIGYGLALAIAWILFRGLSSVVIVALGPSLGVFWTLGLLPYFGLDGNPFNAVVVPVLLCMVGFTDGVHMMVQIRRHRAAGVSSVVATKQSMREVGLACWLTSVTTAIGFGSLALARHPIVREFGFSCVIGVLMCFLAVVLAIPLACASRLGRNVHVGYGKNLIDHNLQRISGIVDFVLRYSRGFAVAAALITLTLALITLQLRPDERLTSALPSNSETAAALAHIDRAFGGMETARVDVYWSPSIDNDGGQVGDLATQVEATLRSEPLIGNPLSIAALLRALPGEGDAASRMSLLELLPPELKRAFYRPEERRTIVTFRLQDIGIAQYGPVFERIETRLAEIEGNHPEFSLRLEGTAVGRWKFLYRIVVDLAASLGTASVIIFVVLTIVYRSLRIGLISTIPNLFPLAATGSVLYFSGQHLELVSVCAFTVCLGIAVDDTIHFLTRFQEEQARCEDREQAIRRAFVGVGTALIMTTAVLVIGFSVALTSDARDHRIFAQMGMLTISTALLGDMLFLPALLARFAPPRRATAPAT